MDIPKFNFNSGEIPIQSEFVDRVKEVKSAEEAMALLEEKLEEKYKTGSFVDNWTRFVLDGKHIIIGG